MPGNSGEGEVLEMLPHLKKDQVCVFVDAQLRRTNLCSLAVNNPWVEKIQRYTTGIL